MINWIRNNFGPEARYVRLQRDVARKEAAAGFAAAEIPLLEKKDKAISVLSKHKKLKESIKKKQMSARNPNGPQNNSMFPKVGEKKPMYKIKTATDRVFGN